MFGFVWFRLVVTISYLYNASMILFWGDCRWSDLNRDNGAISVPLWWSYNELGKKESLKDISDQFGPTMSQTQFSIWSLLLKKKQFGINSISICFASYSNVGSTIGG